MIPLDTYGLHWQDEFAFLHEKGSSICLTPGFPDLPSPFEVVRPRTATPCPHELFVGPGEPDVRVPSHPLVHAMAPVPHPNPVAYYIDASARGVVEFLTTMSGLVGVPTIQPWATKLKTVTPRLTVSNISPVVITSYDFKDLPDIRHLMDQRRTRPIILCGIFQPPNTVPIPTDGLEKLRVAQPWRAIGQTILRRWVTKECSVRTRLLTSLS